MSKEMGGGAHTNNFAKFDRGSNSVTQRGHTWSFIIIMSLLAVEQTSFYYNMIDPNVRNEYLCLQGVIWR